MPSINKGVFALVDRWLQYIMSVEEMSMSFSDKSNEKNGDFPVENSISPPKKSPVANRDRIW